jgi:hypothetical protein
MVLPLATPLYDLDNKFRGLVGVEVTLDKLIESTLTTGAVGHIELAALVDRSGKVMSHKGKADPQSAIASVVDAIAGGRSGMVQTKLGGRDVLVSYTPVSTVDWYLVAVADIGNMIASGKPGDAPEGSVVVQAPASAQPVAATTAAAPANTPTSSPETTASASATSEPSAAPPASASASASATASAVPTPSAATSAAPASAKKNPWNTPTPKSSGAGPSNPFDPWKAYDKKGKK